MCDDGDQAEEVRAEAAEWFARLKTVPVSRGTLEEFFAWRRIDGNNEAFEAVERFWGASALAADRPGIRSATEAALERGRRRRGRLGMRRRAIAATCAVLAIGGVATTWAFHDRGQAYETQVGQQSVVTLEDGSRMTLDTGTRVTVRYDAQARHVRLDRGQASFTVAHATDRPFTVSAGEAEVRATGTRFEVRLDGGTRVTLLEGRVLVSAPGEARPLPLAPGQQLQFRTARPPLLRPVDTAAASAWTRGRIVLDETRLADAVTEVNRYTTKPVRLDAPGHADSRLSGSFDTGDVAGFVAAATALLPVAATREADGRIRLTDAERKTPE
ncbi:FecR family protein [Sphingomonas sp.]|uniref:FecR family protein n=1 Tax=Sphingomonas sp. TaxID=28214 RepID=UPI0025D511D3|nr:FecR domain-containing protein [Sphingomonas sp.]